jgi:hypothetical protein
VAVTTTLLNTQANYIKRLNGGKPAKIFLPYGFVFSRLSKTMMVA